MNKPIVRALLLDALYQILDNKVFRLLIILVMVPVALSFLVGFREEEIVFFFGLKTFDYSGFLSMFESAFAGKTPPRIQAIQIVQRFLVESLSGNVGILFCIAATSFFVPRMLEQGTADTLFSKPLSRATLLVARYLSGVLFVFLLASALVVGVHLGLTLVSGYSDPGFLWGILTLTYVFALVHSFSTCVAALTRSSTAAILCTLVFFMGAGCTHSLWLAKEHNVEIEETRDGTEAEDPEGRQRTGPALDREDKWIKVLITALDIAHYTLPKTTDADALTSILRRSVEGTPEVIEDTVGGLTIYLAPNFGEEYEVVGKRLDQDNDVRFEVDWTVSNASGKEYAQIRIQRLHRRFETQPDGSQGAELAKHLNSRIHSRQRPEELEGLAGVTGAEAVRGRVAKRSASFVRWTEVTNGEAEQREEVLFGFEDYFYLLSSRWKADWLTEDERELHMQYFLDGFSFPALEEVLVRDHVLWFKNRLSVVAPLKFNILFSIGSSIAFAIAMLFISWLALRRINF